MRLLLFHSLLVAAAATAAAPPGANVNVPRDVTVVATPPSYISSGAATIMLEGKEPETSNTTKKENSNTAGERQKKASKPPPWFKFSTLCALWLFTLVAAAGFAWHYARVFENQRRQQHYDEERFLLPDDTLHGGPYHSWENDNL